MGHHKLFYQDSKTIRDKLQSAERMAQAILRLENYLVESLWEIDKKRYFVKLGYKSLTGFCREYLGFSRVQTQRLVTHVRRAEPTANIVDERYWPNDRRW